MPVIFHHDVISVTSLLVTMLTWSNVTHLGMDNCSRAPIFPLLWPPSNSTFFPVPWDVELAGDDCSHFPALCSAMVFVKQLFLTISPEKFLHIFSGILPLLYCSFLSERPNQEMQIALFHGIIKKLFCDFKKLLFQFSKIISVSLFTILWPSIYWIKLDMNYIQWFHSSKALAARNKFLSRIRSKSADCRTHKRSFIHSESMKIRKEGAHDILFLWNFTRTSVSNTNTTPVDKIDRWGGGFLYGGTRKLAYFLNGIRKSCIYIVGHGNFVFWRTEYGKDPIQRTLVLLKQ